MKNAAILIMLGVALPCAMLAGPVTYDISFTGTGLLPTAASFTYDPNTATFTAFSVTWDGLLFDLTSSANAPRRTSPDPACISPLTGGAASFALLSGACSPPASGFTTDWTAGIDSNPPASTDAFFNFFDGNNQGVDDHIQVTTLMTIQSGSSTFTAGEWSITAASSTPEPADLTLTLLGALVLAGRYLRDSHRNSQIAEWFGGTRP
jgi:hypothetical protein